MDSTGPQTAKERYQGKALLLFLYAYVMLLPIGTGLAGIIGQISFMNYLAVGIVLTGLFYCARKRVILLNKNIVPTVLYFIYTIISVLWANKIEMNWYVVTNMVNFVLFMVLVSYGMTEKDVKGVEHCIGLSQIIVFWAVLKNISSLFRYRLNITVVSSIGISDFACGLCLIMALCLNMTTLNVKRRWKVLAYLCAILDFSIILMSGSRGAVIMALAMIFTLFLLGNYSNKTKIITLAVIIFSVILFYQFFLPFLPHTVKDRLTLEAVIKTHGSGRFRVWKIAWETFLNSSFMRQLFGNGFNSFMYVIRYGSQGGHQDLMAHNVIVQMLVEGGILGVILLLGMIISQFHLAIKKHDNMMIIALVGLFISALSIDMQVTRIWGFILTFNCIRYHCKNYSKR